MLIPNGGLRRTTIFAVALIAVLGLSTSKSFSTSPAPSILISQTPLTVAIPAHPQIVFALGNSQSMDGDLSGAVMTGSGSLGGTLGAYAATQLAASSSPVNYNIPTGFTPPANPGASGQAPYTVNTSGTLVDNSASRLNVAKAGISAILNSFMEYADFSLMDYQTANLGEYATWVYYMSPGSGGFIFTSTPGTSDYVANPCYNADVAQPDAYSQSCATLLANYGSASGITTQPYMLIGASSDDPLINDVFYAQVGYQPPVCTDGVPNPLDPYASFGLSNYETGGVTEFYGVQWGLSGYTWSCTPGMAPTNAGYVPYSSQVMQVMRGFGYDATTQSPTAGTLLVPMQSSGSAPSAATVAAAIGAFTPYLQPETSDPSTTEIKAVAEQSPTAGLVKGAAQYLSNGNPPSTNACAPAQYIVLLTDGLPTKDLSGNSWPPLGTASAAGYGVTASFNSDGSLASTNDQALTDAIAQISAAASEGIKTYVIGLGAGVDPSNNSQAAKTLTAMAVAGGTGSYFAANSPTALSADMQVILSRILAAVRSSASATVNTTALSSTSMIFLPSFDTSDVNQDWTGDIKAYPINPGTGEVDTSVPPAWSAQAQVDAQTSGSGWTSRLIATWDPVARAGIPFEWSSGTPSQGIAVSTTLGQELETNTADPSGQDALDYLRGDSQLSIANGGAYRNRTHILGDIVDSNPAYVGAAIGPYQSSSYVTFENTYKNRTPVLYVGGNDGMLHAFSATTGEELFAYIPNGVFSNLVNLTNPYYNQDHQFYADGSPQVGDVQFSDQSWHTELVGGERAGGSTIYALDVTNPSAINSESALASSVLWEFSDPAHMGLSFSTPVIAPTAVGASANKLGFTVFFGNGYNSASETPYLYAVDPQTGSSLPGTPLNLCASAPTACNSSLPNGLSNINVISNLGGVGTPATTIYAGDLQGNLWRVDIRDADPTNWVVTLLFKATDASGTPQPITTTPAVSLNPEFPRLAGTMVYVGTGQLLGTTDLNTTQIQTMYGVYDSGSNTTTLRRANLVSQCLTEQLVSGKTLRFVHGNQITLPSQNGWLVDFNVPSNPNPSPCGSGAQTDVGERIVSDPRLVGGALTVITERPSPTSTTSSTISPSSGAHADLAKATHPSGNKAGPSAPSAPFVDSVVYVTNAPQAGGAELRGVLTPSFDGVYHPAGATARLWSVGLGVAPPPTLVSIAVTPGNPTVTAGQTEEFTATGTYSDGSTKSLTTQVTWSSSDTTVATIGSQGLASSTTAGSTTIRASLGAISGDTTLTVTTPPPPPPPPTLVSIAVTPANQTIDIGGTEQYTATGTYSDGSTLNLTVQVTWSSSSTAIATISGGGLASGVAQGSTTITASLGSVSGDTTLTVITPPPPPPPPTLESITVTPANPTIYVGQTQQFTATAHYSDGTTQNVTSTATWSSSNTAVGTIASRGLASGVAVGSTSITATLDGVSGGTTLTVVNRPPPPTLTSITVTPANPAIYAGQTQQFTATGHYSDGSTQNLTSAVTWSSSTPAIGTIASSGLSTGVSAGTTSIVATDGTVSGNTGLTVRNRPPPPTLLSISVAPPNPTIEAGQTQQFTATGHYSDGSTQNLTSVVAWGSSNTGVATIAAGGLATSAAIGVTTISATDGSISGSTTLTVESAPAPPPPPVCPGGDVSYLMEFNFAGGAFSTPVFNYNGTGAVDSTNVPANGMLLGGTNAAGPVFTGGTSGTGGLDGHIQLGNDTQLAFFQSGFQRQRYSWWEIR